MYLLDTNIVSERMRKRPSRPVLAKLAETADKPRYLSVISLRELRFGAALRGENTAVFWAAIEQRCLPLAASLDFTAADALVAGALSARLRQKGIGISENDLLLAAHALSRKLTFVTRNIRHFRGIENLSLENWFD